MSTLFCLTPHSNQLLLVYHQPELESQLLRRLAAKDHPLQEYLEIVHHGAVARVDGQLQLDKRVRLVDLQLRPGDGVRRNL